MAEATPPFLVVSLDLDNITAQIVSVVERLTKSNSIPVTGIKRETFDDLDNLMREVIKIARSGFVPDLGPRLYAKFQELDSSAHCTELLALEWRHIKDDPETKAFLEAMTYLKLAALCAFDEARYTWASFAKKVQYESLQHEALSDGDFIKLYKETGRNCYSVDALHEYVDVGLYLICKAYKRTNMRYMLYKLMLNAQSYSIIPSGVADADWAGQLSTQRMVNFIIEKLEGT